MTQRILITGGNRGIGLALVKQYLKDQHQIWAVCRKASDDLKRTGATIIEGIDLTSDSFEEKLLKQVEGLQFDIVINNAGILLRDPLGDIQLESLQKQYLVNAIAPIRVTQALAGHLVPGAKIAMITSRMGSIEDNTSGGSYGYRMSKAALNAGSKSLANDLKSQEIAVAILHPGYVQTDMVGNRGDITAEEAADRLKSRIDELTLDSTGTFWHSSGSVLPW